MPSDASESIWSKYEYLVFEDHGNGILGITINRPEVLNATNATLHAELVEVWLDVARDPSVSVAVITGAGRAFSAGGDLAMLDAQMGSFEETLRIFHEAAGIVENMINCDKPIISAINGVAVGAGLAVAILADISIIGEDVKFTDGHMRLGLVAGDHAAGTWPLLCGMAKAKYYLLTSEFIDGREAERIGLVSRCVPQDQVVSVAYEVAEKLARGPQHALRWTKRSLNQWYRSASAISDASMALEMLCFFDQDIVEGVRALREKRSPQFPSVTDATTEMRVPTTDAKDPG